MATCSSVLAWKIPWIEGYSQQGHKELDTTKVTQNTHTHTHTPTHSHASWTEHRLFSDCCYWQHQNREPSHFKTVTMSESVLPMFSSRSFIVSGLTFRSLIHLSLFLCMVLESVLVSFFYKWLTSFPSTTC